MAMRESCRLLTVFLASPADVEIERNSAEDVVNAINRSIGRKFGWQIDLHRWEDTPPGFGRPQSMINPMLDDCALFIGLLWERWGHTTGDFSSGFEEEFERAKSRRNEFGAPDIWLVFKTPNPGKIQDPGIQLASVLEFRKRQIASNEILFKEVSDSNDWVSKLQSWLTEYLLTRWMESRADGDHGSLALPSPSRQSNPAIDSTTENDADGRALARYIALAKTIKSVSESNLLEEAFNGGKILTEEDVSSLFLFSKTLMSRRYTADVIGTHEINLIFKNRNHLDPMQLEKMELLRSMMGGTHGEHPGWFWFRDIETDAVGEFLLALAFDDRLEEVRRNSLRLISLANLTVSQSIWPFLGLVNDTPYIREGALKFFETQGQTGLNFLEEEKLKATKEIADEIDNSIFALRAELDPNSAMSDLLNREGYIAHNLVSAIAKSLNRVDLETLKSGLKSSTDQVKKICLRELLERKALSSEELRALLQGAARERQLLILQALLDQGAITEFQEIQDALKSTEEDNSRLTLLGSIGNEDAGLTEDFLAFSFWRTQPKAKQEEAIDWFSTSGRSAYKAFAVEHFEDVGELLRADIAEGFERIRKESVVKLEKEYGVDGARRIETSWASLTSYLRSRFTEAALEALAPHATAADASLVRGYLLSSAPDSAYWAADILSRIGGPEDAQKLFDLALNSYGKVRVKAANAALKLSSDFTKLAWKLVDQDNDDLMKVGFLSLLDSTSAEVKAEFIARLHNESIRKRAWSVAYLARYCEADELQQLLDDYIRTGTYYYNVVTWLDRILYSPSVIRQVYEKQLAGI
jgi:hypothetical protein